MPMMPGRGGPGSSYYESVQKFAPILVAVLFIVIAVALARNFIEARLHPEARGRQFDPVKNFSKINSRGMVNVLMKRSDQ